MSLHTIIGSGGTVANELLPVLLANKEKVRLVSRRAKPISTAEAIAADVTKYEEVLQAVQGSTIVYLLVGLTYETKVWQTTWPLVMTNVINACKATGAKLIFFDNVYMYGRVSGEMTEETPFNPCSKKGEVRAAIATQLLDEIKAGTITAMIARAADFYGPVGFTTSVPNMLVFDNLRKGKKAQWLVNAKVPHSFTYVPDAAKALYLLAKQETAFGQTWHLPTAGNVITGEAFVQLAAAAMQQPNKYQLLPIWMLRLAGLFNKTIQESIEMSYQSAHAYYFNSDKFNKAFSFVPTSYKDGIQATATWALSQ